MKCKECEFHIDCPIDDAWYERMVLEPIGHGGENVWAGEDIAAACPLGKRIEELKTTVEELAESIRDR